METCPGKLIAKETYIKTPNYPRKYPKNADCSWTFTGPKDKVIELTISHFDVDWRTHDCLDYVEIFNVNTTKGYEEKLGRFCNRKKPAHTILSTGNELKIKFYSSSSNEFKGFRIDYTSVQPGVQQGRI